MNRQDKPTTARHMQPHAGTSQKTPSAIPNLSTENCPANATRNSIVSRGTGGLLIERGARGVARPTGEGVPSAAIAIARLVLSVYRNEPLLNSPSDTSYRSPRPN